MIACVKFLFKKLPGITEKALKNTNPKKISREDLLAQLGKWRAKGDRVALVMDANNDVIDGAMSKQLTRRTLISERSSMRTRALGALKPTSEGMMQ